MKLLAPVLVILLLASCQKHKERKAWKAWYGMYQIDAEPLLMFNDFHGDSVYATRLGINKYGISFSTESGSDPSCTFERLDECDNPGFDYQLKFVEIRLFVFGSGGSGQVLSPTEEELNNNRTYYLKRLGDNKILFMVKEDGVPDNQIVLNME